MTLKRLIVAIVTTALLCMPLAACSPTAQQKAIQKAVQAQKADPSLKAWSDKELGGHLSPDGKTWIPAAGQ
jgi:hypothetical protein